MDEGGVCMRQYAALLRGINVGGKNIIKMADLKACFEGMGFTGVRTYIQSGNVLFWAAEPDQAKLTSQIEAALSTVFDYESVVVVRSGEEMKAVVARAPEGFGSDPDAYRYDVIFLRGSLSSAEVIETVPTKPGVDAIYAGYGVVYFSRLIAKASSSRLSRVASMPIYQSMTIRNWRTTNKLVGMIEAAVSPG
jgi:uncharacterized protein (DUF1697 family)